MKKSFRLSKLLTGLSIIAITLVLNGCLMNRVSTVHKQFCDFDSNFNIQFSDAAEMNFINPVLLDTDVVWMADAEPTEVIIRKNEKLMVYVMEKAVKFPDPAHDLRVSLKFERIDDQYKLATVQFDPKLNALINPEIMDPETISLASQNLCNVGWSMASRKIELDISGQDLDELPDRMEILALAGKPLEQDDMTTKLSYEYRLKGDHAKRPSARFTVWFDHTGQILERMESQYSYFHTSTDFVTRKMQLRVKI